MFVGLFNITVMWASHITGTSGKELACQCRTCKSYGFDPWVRKIPWRRARQLTSVLLPGESHGQRSLAGDSSYGCKQVQLKQLSTVDSRMEKTCLTSDNQKGTVPFSRLGCIRDTLLIQENSLSLSLQAKLW